MHLTLAMPQVSLKDDSGNNRDDLTLPKGTSDAEALAKQLRDDFDAGKELVVTVLKVATPRKQITLTALWTGTTAIIRNARAALAK